MYIGSIGSKHGEIKVIIPSRNNNKYCIILSHYTRNAGEKQGFSAKVPLANADIIITGREFLHSILDGARRVSPTTSRRTVFFLPTPIYRCIKLVKTAMQCNALLNILMRVLSAAKRTARLPGQAMRHACCMEAAVAAFTNPPNHVLKGITLLPLFNGPLMGGASLRGKRGRRGGTFAAWKLLSGTNLKSIPP